MRILGRYPAKLLLLFSVQIIGCAQAERSNTPYPQAFTGIEFVGRVVAVADGDTVSVMHLGKSEKVRLNGIDCPEEGQAFGTRAKQFTSELAFGKEVAVRTKDRDKYGRTVGDVVLPDGRFLNRELVAAGLAWWYRAYSNDETLGELEVEAKAAKRGLWIDSNPQPPWEFRRSPRTDAAPPSAATQKSGDNPPIADQSEKVTVYVTRTGSKYHSDGCRYLAKSKIPMTLVEAKKRYSPCSSCAPPK